MKKFVKRALAMALAVIMLVSVLGVAAFADRNEKLPQYKTYTVLGDSNASGYGTDAYFENAGSTESVKEGDLIAGSYPAIVADALGCETVYVHSHSGWRTNEFLYMIEPGSIEYSDFFLHALGFVADSTLAGEGAAIVADIKKADLISIDFGSNDIYSYTLYETYGMHEDELNAMLDDMNAISADPSVFFNQLLTAADKLGILKQLVADFKANLDKNTAVFEANIATVVEKVRELNPDAKILMMGVFCPISFDLRVNHEVILDFKSNSDKRMKSINAYLKNECPVKDEYTFVDITKTECYGFGALDTQKLIALDENVKYSAVKMVHPNESGHVYIANQILDTMISEFSAPELAASYSRLLKRTTLTWNKVDGACCYRVYRACSEDGSYKYIGSSTNGVFYDLLSVRGNTYYYKVCAVMNYKNSVVSPMSNPVSIVAK